MAAKVLGNQDKLTSALALDVTGGKDLKLKLTMNVKLYGSFFTARGVAGSAEPLPPPK